MGRVHCSICKREVRTDDRMAGQKVTCEACRRASTGPQTTTRSIPAWALVVGLFAGLFLLFLFLSLWPKYFLLAGASVVVAGLALNYWTRQSNAGRRPVKPADKIVSDSRQPRQASQPVTAPPRSHSLDNERYPLFHGTVAIGEVEGWDGSEDDPTEWHGLIEYGPGFYGGKIDNLTPLAEFAALSRLRGQLLFEKRDASHVDQFMETKHSDLLHSDLLQSDEWRLVDSQGVSIPISCPILSEELVVWVRDDNKTWR